MKIKKDDVPALPRERATALDRVGHSPYGKRVSTLIPKGPRPGELVTELTRRCGRDRNVCRALICRGVRAPTLPSRRGVGVERALVNVQVEELRIERVGREPAEDGP